MGLLKANGGVRDACACGVHVLGRCDKDFPSVVRDVRPLEVQARVRFQQMRARAIIDGDRSGRARWEDELRGIGYTNFDPMSATYEVVDEETGEISSVTDAEMSHLNSCVECGVTFNSKRSDARFCSPRCRKAGSRRD